MAGELRNYPSQMRPVSSTARHFSMALALVALVGCKSSEINVQANTGEVTVGVVPVKSMPLSRSLTLSSELVPFQEIDVYAKESGYVKQLLVDYGTRVKEGQLI